MTNSRLHYIGLTEDQWSRVVEEMKTLSLLRGPESAAYELYLTVEERVRQTTELASRSGSSVYIMMIKDIRILTHASLAVAKGIADVLISYGYTSIDVNAEGHLVYEALVTPFPKGEPTVEEVRKRIDAALELAVAAKRDAEDSTERDAEKEEFTRFLDKAAESFADGGSYRDVRIGLEEFYFEAKGLES